MNNFIPVNTPLVDGKEAEYLKQCIETGWISSEGAFVKQFEDQFAKCVGRKFGIAVCNGSAAIDVSVTALDIGPGDEVIVPSFTIISCLSQIVRSGALPVVIDADPITWNMNVHQIEGKITSRTKAIMPVHIYGLPVDMDPVLEIAQKYKLKIIEDAAEAHGLDYKRKPCGSFGDISTFSFYPNKHITTGEGGMIVTNDEFLAERCRSLRNLCFQAEQRFVHKNLGWNMRMSNLQAAVGVAQLERLDYFVQKKRAMGQKYTELLRDVPGIQLPLVNSNYASNIYWVFGLVLEEEVDFDAKVVMKMLEREGIGTRPFFWPMHKQPVFQKRGLFQNERCPVAERLALRGFYIPSGLSLDESEIITVTEKIKMLLGNKK